MIDVPTITGGMFRSARQSVQFNFKSYQGLVTQILIKPLSSLALAHPLRVQYPISKLHSLALAAEPLWVVLCWGPSY